MWGGFSLLFSLCSCSLSGLIHVNDYRMKPHRQQLWIYCSFLKVPTGDGRRRGEGKGGVVPWGGHNTSIANQRGQIPYSVTWGLEAFEIPTFNSRSLSPFYLKTVSLKHKIFLLFSPNISCCSSLSQCNVLPGERCNFFAFTCCVFRLGTGNAVGWPCLSQWRCEHTAPKILLHNCCTLSEPQVPSWASVFNLPVKVKAHFCPIGHTEKRRRMFCPGFCCILTFTLPKHKLLMFKYFILFTSSFQELPDYLQISLLSNLPFYRHQTSTPGLHNLCFLCTSALLPLLLPLWCFPALFIAPVLPSSPELNNLQLFCWVFSGSPIFPSDVSSSLGLPTTPPLPQTTPRSLYPQQEQGLDVWADDCQDTFPKPMAQRFHLPCLAETG